MTTLLSCVFISKKGNDWTTISLFTVSCHINESRPEQVPESWSGYRPTSFLPSFSLINFLYPFNFVSFAINSQLSLPPSPLYLNSLSSFLYILGFSISYSIYFSHSLPLFLAFSPWSINFLFPPSLP